MALQMGTELPAAPVQAGMSQLADYRLLGSFAQTSVCMYEQQLKC